MISDITIGQYFPGDSVIHKMDARVKTILVMAVIVSFFLCKNFLSLLLSAIAVTAIVAISKTPFKTILKSLKPLSIIIAFTAVLNLFYGDGEALVTLGRLTITADGIFTAIFIAVRIVLLVIIGSLLTYTTTPTDLTDAIERLMKPLKIFRKDIPHTIAMTMTIAIRFIPTLVEEIEKIMMAQKSRGADLDSGSIFHRAKALVPVIIPLFISSFRRANDLAYAMECRCYRGGVGRTKMKVVKVQKRDYIAMLLVAAYFALIFLLNSLMAGVI
ncbi:MAG: energy-coupling factor transporter transmembrane protein EcfT [Clostridiales bacterium]|nr:energy-coupling factor transporter transmembrane protein EcfT [Clostridiales bacterium]